jgi:hypothetical protein
MSISRIRWSSPTAKSGIPSDFYASAINWRSLSTIGGVLYQPILSAVMLQRIQFQVVGATIDVSEFTLDELIRRL